MRIQRILVFASCCLAFSGWVRAQSTHAYTRAGFEFDAAVSLYQDGHYAAAKNGFVRAERLLQTKSEPGGPGSISVYGGRTGRDLDHMRKECMYYKAMCDVYSLRRNGASALKDFVEAYPESNRVNDAYLQLGHFEYNYRRYRPALEYYEKVNTAQLDEKNGDMARFCFRAGYAAFQIKKYEQAKKYFQYLMDNDTRYSVLASYYYGYMNYTEGNYQTALQIFESIQNDSALKAVIPLYMLQCYHVLGQNDKVLETGPQLMASAKPKRAAEIGRMTGEAYFNVGRYAEALPYMTNFYNNSSVLPDAGGCYILGYCYYKTEYYDSAAVFFQKVLDLEPTAELRQTCLYHLGYCYVQTGKKKFAMDAFGDAARIKGANDVTAEDAAYHRAQLACEMGLSSYQSSIKVLEDFLAEYPNSVYSKRIYSYLAGMYSTTRDYDKALASIEKLSVKTPEMEAAHRRLLYNKGVELFLRRKYASALDYFSRCAAMGTTDDVWALRSLYWQGECYAVSGDYVKAAHFYQRFLNAPASRSVDEYPLGVFSMAFAAMQNVNYPQALRYWNEFLSGGACGSRGDLKAEAYARKADCHYMTEEYGAAVENYTLAAENNFRPVEYVEFQKALCLGARGEYRSKIELLLSMERNRAEGNYKVKIWQELGSTYLMVDENDRALQYYRKVKDNRPGSAASLNASTKMGLIYFNKGDNEQALNCFKQVAKQNPSGEEGRQALVSIRNIYMSMNQIDQFFAYVKTLPSVKIEQVEQDSLTYLSAENFFLDGDFTQAKIGFNKYLEAYPEGIFAVDAWKNLAVCAEKTGDRETLKNAYAKITYLKINESESAARNLADMLYGEKNYKTALGYYTELERLSEAGSRENYAAALVGKMRCYKGLGKAKDVVDAALAVLRADGVNETETDEARYFIAVTAQSLGQKELSMEQYEYLTRSKNPDYASEACYMLLESRFRAEFYDEAEKMIFDLISSSTVNDYYLAKSYLLWADIYYVRGNVLQARQTLQSIIDNYEGDDLREVAQSKMDLINQSEAERLKKEESFREERYGEDDDVLLPQM